MDNNDDFQKIEEDVVIEDVTSSLDNVQEAFVTGLPDWDLEPLYEPVKRGNK